jgi:riboflavin synthase
MFTGLIEELGSLRTREGGRFTFAAELVTGDADLGDSIAVNGCCLTVVELGPGLWSADVVDETLARTNLGALRPGDPVNLERPLRPTDRLGGHFVQGHVDGLGEVVQPAPELVVRTSGARYLVEKGSIAVDGVSLTVVGVTEDTFRVAVIPHTAAVTTLGHRRPGDAVNLEFDILGKYVERLLPR